MPFHFHPARRPQLRPYAQARPADAPAALAPATGTGVEQGKNANAVEPAPVYTPMATPGLTPAERAARADELRLIEARIASIDQFLAAFAYHAEVVAQLEPQRERLEWDAYCLHCLLNESGSTAGGAS